MAKNSFVLYKSQCQILLNLSDLEIGVFFRNIINYQINGSIPQINGIHEKMIYDLFINQMEVDAVKYDATCQKKAESGKRGGLRSGEARSKQNEARLSKRSKAKQTKQGQPENENENENDFTSQTFSPDEIAELEKPF